MNKINCCLCGKECENEYGNNPEPLMRNSDTTRCCNECNNNMVIPARLYNKFQGRPLTEPLKFNLEELKKLTNFIENNA